VKQERNNRKRDTEMGNIESIKVPKVVIRHRSNSVPSNIHETSSSGTHSASGKPRSRRNRIRIRRPFSHEDDEEGAGAASSGPGSDDESDGDDEPKEAPPPFEVVVDKAQREMRRVQMLKETLAPVQSQEEFCNRFGVGEAQYKVSRDVFQKLAGDKDFVTDREWLDDAPQTEAAQEWVRNIWRAFAPADNKMTLSEWLVFDGIRKYGSLDQRVVGSFVLYDHNNDGVVEREEVAAMMRTAAAVAGEGVSESLIQQAVEILMSEADKQHTGLMELEDILNAARIQPVIAKIFNAV